MIIDKKLLQRKITLDLNHTIIADHLNIRSTGDFVTWWGSNYNWDLVDLDQGYFIRLYFKSEDEKILFILKKL